MTWDLTGKTVTGFYLGAYPIRGRVVSSRVKYGGSVQYTVVLDEPVQFPWRSEPSDRLLVDAEMLVA